MPLITPPPVNLRAVLFDLDEALLSRGRAWQYTVEEAIVTVSGRRLSAGPLAAEYRNRPWRHALSVLLEDPAEIERCEQLCDAMFGRSALKRFTVHEGLGMALDHLLGARIEVGAITREPHAMAIKQIQSTGLDRFLTVLSATPAGEVWDVAVRLAECLRFLDREPGSCAFVGPDAFDLRLAGERGFACYAAGWCEPIGDVGAWSSIFRPGDLARVLRR